MGVSKIQAKTNRWLLVGLLGLFWMAANAYGTELSALKNAIGPQDALLVADGQGAILVSKNASTKLVPASVLKVFTAWMALEYLGADFRFQTEFYTDPAGNLKIKGYGDPLLISELMPGIARQLRQRIDGYRDLILDDSHFAPVTIPGVTNTLNPYDAPNGALCVNFNTVCFHKKGGKYRSREPQTPLLPFVMDRVKRCGLGQGRIILSAEQNETTLYAGHLFAHFFKQAGIESGGAIRMGRVDPRTDRLIFSFTSPFSLKAIIARLLEYSNNFMANQLFITVGIEKYGPPGTLEKGARAAAAFSQSQLGSGLALEEGSGISRGNRLSANTLHRILKGFAPYRALMPRQGRALYKTGTLTGVQTRAGYVENGDKPPYRFVLMLNSGKAAPPLLARLLRALDGR